MWIIGCKLVQSVAAIIISAISARYLGPSGFGIISFAAAIVAFAVPIMQLGITDVIVRDLVEHPSEEGEIIGTSLTLCCLSAALSILGIYAFITIASGNETETVIVVLLYSLCLVFQALEVSVYWFQAKLQSKYTSLISFGAYIIVSGYKIWLLVNGKSIYWFAVSNALDYMIIAAFQLIYYKKLGGAKLMFSRQIAKRLLNAGKYYIIPNLMIVIFANTDRIMLKYMIGADATGQYSAAVVCAGMTGFVFVAIINSFRPVIFESASAEGNAFETFVLRLFRIIVVLSLLQSIVICAFPAFFVKILYGDAYMSSVSALRIIVWYTTFSYLGGAVGIWILAQQQQKWLLLVNTLGAIGNVLLNLALIPRYGICGAAAASFMTQFFTNVVIGLLIKPIRRGYILILKAFDPRGWIGDITALTSGGNAHRDAR